MLIWIALLLFAFSVFMLAIGGIEPPRHIETFNRESERELAFERRAGWYRLAGYIALALALVVGVISYLTGW